MLYNLLTPFLILQPWRPFDILNWDTIDYLLPLIFLEGAALHFQYETSSIYVLVRGVCLRPLYWSNPTPPPPPTPGIGRELVLVPSNSKRHKNADGDTKNIWKVIFIRLSYLTLPFGIKRCKLLCLPVTWIKQRAGVTKFVKCTSMCATHVARDVTILRTVNTWQLSVPRLPSQYSTLQRMSNQAG